MIQLAFQLLFVGVVTRLLVERCPVTKSSVHVCNWCWVVRASVVMAVVMFVKGL